MIWFGEYRSPRTWRITTFGSWHCHLFSCRLGGRKVQVSIRHGRDILPDWTHQSLWYIRRGRLGLLYDDITRQRSVNETLAASLGIVWYRHRNFFNIDGDLNERLLKSQLRYSMSKNKTNKKHWVRNLCPWYCKIATSRQQEKSQVQPATVSDLLKCRLYFRSYPIWISSYVASVTDGRMPGRTRRLARSLPICKCIQSSHKKTLELGKGIKIGVECVDLIFT